MGIHEFMECTEDIKDLIRHEATVPSIRQRAMQNGMRTMLQDGIKKVLQGHTDMRQIYHVCMI